MKLKVFAAIAAASSLLMAVSCNKENSSDNSWKEIPAGEISSKGGDAVLTVNGVSSARGTAQLTATSADKASLTLNDFIPGYGKVTLPVGISKSDDGKSFDFYGTTTLAAPKINLTKENAAPAPYELVANGNISLEGKISVNVSTAVRDEARGGIAGKWDLLRKAGFAKDGTPATSPLVLKWSIPGQDQKTAAIENIAKLYGGATVANLIDRISLLDNGNFTAKYYAGEDLPPIGEPKIGKDGYEFNASHNTWAELPAKGCVLWYAANGYLHLVPDPASIAAATGETESASLEELMKELNDLKQYGVDTQKLAAVLIEIMNNGIVCRYASSGESLSIVMDKALLDPAVQAFIPALPTLDKALEGMLQDPKQKETAELIYSALKYLGLTKPSELGPLWNASTEFSVTLNFIRGK